MVVQIDADMVYDRDPRLSLRDHGTFMRESNREAAVFHHTKHIPTHFKKIAARKYGYAPRRSRLNRNLTYQGLKDKLSLPPLVSPRDTGGTTRQYITTQRQITATQKQAKLRMRLPWRGGTGRFKGIPGQRKLTTQQKTIIQIRAELETVAPDEQRAINRFMHKSYVEKANKRQSQKVRKRVI